MIKKNTKIAGTILSALALISLDLPLYNATIGEGETWITTLRGFNLVEFSPWGAVVLLLPFFLLGIMHSKLSDKTKTVLNMGTFLLGAVSTYNAGFAMREWIYAHATAYAQPHPWLIIYGMLIFLSAVVCHISYNAQEHTKSTSASAV